MKVRSITCFYDPGFTHPLRIDPRLALFAKNLEDACQSAGIEVQSRRLATIPFMFYDCYQDEDSLIKYISSFEIEAKMAGFSHLSCGPALPNTCEYYKKIHPILAKTQDVFLSAVIADEKQIYPWAVVEAAHIIHETAKIRSDGFANLRFAALANVKPGAPFLPAAFHNKGARPAFALAIECADVVIQAFKRQISLKEAREKMLLDLRNIAVKIEKLIPRIPDADQYDFLGFDFSPAPFPEDWCSLAGAIETIGDFHVGPAGTLCAAAVIAETLDRGDWKRTGFNGLMLPVLEDSVLAKRAISGELSIKDLLLYSTVCGTGLDTVPLAGDTTVEELTGILLDVATLSVRLNKPLTARLMPLPGKKAGDKTHFDFGFFADSCVMPLVSQGIHPPLFGNEAIPLAPKCTFRNN